MVLVVGILVLSMIIFASLINRVRQENAVTARVSVNERLYQVASAVGRLAIRKLQKDFETKDPDFANKILKAVFTQNKTGLLPEEDYSDVINNLDVVKDIKARFKGKWGEVDFTVKFQVDLGKKYAFSAPINGVVKNPYERKGYVNAKVTVHHLGVSKEYLIRKELYLTSLLPWPFHRFTLFSHKGATISPTIANQTFLTDEGKLKSSQGNRPLVCYNRLIRTKKKGLEGLDFRFNRADNIVKTFSDGNPSFVKNGWIYLGGRGHQVDSKKDSGNLILNVNTGSKDDCANKYFGEFFHFYFNPNSQGWLISRDWTNFFNQNISGNDLGGEVSKIMISFVDYGYFKGLWQIPFRKNYLFKTALKIFKNRNTSEDIDRGSSMHLFGTPGLCTPTLIFGKVKRRFVRTFAFYFSEKSKIYPLRGFTHEKTLEKFIDKELTDWFQGIIANKEEKSLMSSLSTMFKNKIDLTKFQTGIKSNSPALCGLDPEVIDYQPYMSGLKNICDPGGPDKKWTEVIPKNDYVQDKPDNICKIDYKFNKDKEIYYSGSIRNLKPGTKYLRDRMSYYIDLGKDTVKLSQCKFFLDKFITKKGKTNQLFLNQIVGFKGNLIIDMPLEVVKGGAIICDGELTIQSPVVNPYLRDSYNTNRFLPNRILPPNPPNHPDAYGFIAFIAQKGITIAAGKKISGNLPEAHGFFISINSGGAGRIRVGQAMHLIGGVASDNIEDLVKNGCIVEWGFEPEELSGGKCLNTSDFYGLAMGPRDIEIITEK